VPLLSASAWEVDVKGLEAVLYGLDEAYEAIGRRA